MNRIDEKTRKDIEKILSCGVSIHIVPTKDGVRVLHFQEAMPKAECHIDEKRWNLIEQILSNGYRVELLPFNGFARIMMIKRKEVKVE